MSIVDAAGWRGTPTSTVDAWLDDLPVIDGTAEVVAWCRAHDIEPVLASLAWQPVSAAIGRRYGLSPNGGPRPGTAAPTSRCSRRCPQRSH
ncbi:MAG: hypothetical protein V4737_02765 [Curtobacterium sp.]